MITAPRYNAIGILDIHLILQIFQRVPTDAFIIHKAYWVTDLAMFNARRYLFYKAFT